MPLKDIHISIDRKLANTLAKDIEKYVTAEMMRSLRTPRFGVVNAVT